MKKIAYIIGTRPEIIRSAFVILSLKADKEVIFKVVHTGQHYDYLMNETFFQEFGLSKPDVNLGVGSGTHAELTANIILKLEKFFLKFRPELVVVFGDTDSSLAAALTAVKLQIPVTHLEAGCRGWEMDMPEEINRRLIDHCSNLLLAVSENCVSNLKKEKVIGQIFNTGDPLYDVFKKCIKEIRKLQTIEKFGLKRGEYFLLTLHRAKNVDEEDNLKNILLALASFKDVPIIFPVHPRTKKRLEKNRFLIKKCSNFVFINPVGYGEILGLVGGAKIAITDSGGLQKEALWCKIPCITLREHSEWVETVNLGINFLTGTDKDKIKKTIHYIINHYKIIEEKLLKSRNPYSKPNITKRIIELLKKFSGKKWNNF